MQVLIELDEEMLERLEKVAPGRSRKRSAFIRAAIQQALWSLEEERTKQAYLDAPDGEPAPFDPSNWEPLAYGGFDPPVGLVSRRKPEARRNPARQTKSAKPRPRRPGPSRKASG